MPLIVPALLTATLLTAMGWLGVGLLRKLAPDFDALEQVAYGVPLGAVATSLAMLASACAIGKLSPFVVVIAGIIAALGGAALAPWRGPIAIALPSRVAMACFLALAARWAVLYWDVYSVDPAGLWTGHVHVWGDWSAHLGDVSSFAYGDNFPPHHPRLAGYHFAYHYLTSITAASMVVLGVPVTTSLAWQSFVFSLAATLALFVFVRRLTGRDGVATLAVGLFLFGGGGGWWLSFRELFGGSGLHHFWARPWDPALQAAANFQWKNVYFSLLLPQRGYLYGLPLTLMALALLYSGMQGKSARPFIAAGVVAGLLPLAHLGSMFALALLTVPMAVLFPTRRLIWFVGVWSALAVPQLLFQQGAQPGALSAMRWQPGWIASPDNWGWFWCKNLGLFWPLLVVALARRSLLPAPTRRLLLAFMFVFVAGNLVVFQPWAWDNTKVLMYWFLATCILVAALLARLWSGAGVPARVALCGLVFALVASGLLENLDQLLGRDRHLLLSTEELRVGEYVRLSTPPRSVFAAAPQHNQPVSLLAGRTVVMGFSGWLWSHGLPYADRERDLHTIFSGGRQTDSLLRRYQVRYILIGPAGRAAWPANVDALRLRYASVLRTENYELFDVTSSGGTKSERRAPPE
jgi:hypothetical protein